MAESGPKSEPNPEKAVFDVALELPAGPERDAWIRQACGGDEVLLERMRALLRASEAPPEFLREAPARPLATAGAAGHTTTGAGTRIGRYRLLEQIGEGGFGIVHMAEQVEPLARKVALKVLKPGMDSRQVIGRFEAERQALALMDHPNIAQVFDAGATESGRPYFVMELVRGIPITEFCESEGLDLEARIELFILVCGAVQHAHQKGIIHRDLKPTNILVTLHGDRAVPKVIDFGIAKAIHQPLTDKTVFTLFQQFVGTPAYMSPEQASLSGLDVDTRSDIYSLGVLLYELLTGTPPFDNTELLRSGPDAMRHTIQEKEPERPSTRHRRRAQGTHRAPRPAKLERLPSDLDWIVLKALEKDRERRYATANGLAADLRRFLNQEPVSAVAPTIGYQLAKLMRRHRVAAAAALGTVVLLTAAATVGTGLAIRAHRAEVLAKERADAAIGVGEFYWKSLLSQLTPWQATNPRVTLREAFDRSAGEVSQRLAEKPLAEASVRLAVGRTYLGLSEFALAETNLVRALELVRQFEMPPGAATAETLYQMAVLRELQGLVVDAARLLDEVADIRRGYLPEDHGDVWGPVAKALLLRALVPGTSNNAPLLRRSLERCREILGKDNHVTLTTMIVLSDQLANLSEFEEACQLLAEARGLAEAAEGPASNNALSCADRLAMVRAKQGQWAEAERLFAEILRLRERHNLPDGVFTLRTKVSYATWVLIPRQRFEEAAGLLMEVAEIIWPRRPESQASARICLGQLLAEWEKAGGGESFERFREQTRAYLQPQP
ncbi:MAG: protein kinase [Limisphaerales bacterium]